MTTAKAKKAKKKYPRPSVFSGTHRIYTTGQVATACNVAPRTAAKWCDSGMLKHYRIPGSEDRRVKREDLIAFMRRQGLPTDRLEESLLVAGPFEWSTVLCHGATTVHVGSDFQLGLTMADDTKSWRAAVLFCRSWFSPEAVAYASKKLLKDKVPVVAVIPEDCDTTPDCLYTQDVTVMRMPLGPAAVEDVLARVLRYFDSRYEV